MTLTNQNVDDLLFVMSHGCDIYKSQTATINSSLNYELCRDNLAAGDNLDNTEMLYDFDNTSNIKHDAKYSIDFYNSYARLALSKSNLTQKQMLNCVHNLAQELKNQGV